LTVAGARSSTPKSQSDVAQHAAAPSPAYSSAAATNWTGSMVPVNVAIHRVNALPPTVADLGPRL
jgi:hypothetical protein